MTDRRDCGTLRACHWLVLVLAFSPCIAALFREGVAQSADHPPKPAPEAKELESALARVKEAYQADLAAVKTPEQAVALAKKMLQDAMATKDDPAGRYALLGLGAECAARAGDKDTALESVRLAATYYDVDE